jgi:hypothetical protein
MCCVIKISVVNHVYVINATIQMMDYVSNPLTLTGLITYRIIRLRQIVST